MTILFVFWPKQRFKMEGLEEIISAAVVLMNQSRRRTLTIDHVAAAVHALYPSTYEASLSAASAFLKRYGAALAPAPRGGAQPQECEASNEGELQDDAEEAAEGEARGISKEEKQGVSLLCKQLRGLLGAYDPPIRINRDLKFYLWGVLDAVSGVEERADPKERLIEATCAVMKLLGLKIISPRVIIVAATIVWPEAQISYTPESPHAGRATTQRASLRDCLKRRIAEAVDGGRLGKDTPACLEYVAQVIDPSSPTPARGDTSRNKRAGVSEAR